MRGSTHIERIAEFLRGPYCEGPQQLAGYIPCNLAGGGTANYYGGADPGRFIPMGVSGVTIGTGVDLGQTSVAELGGMGLCPADYLVFAPYAGRRRQDAVMALHERPLKIGRDLANRLDDAVLARHAGLISARYDRDAGAGAWQALPWQAQAVIFSILYQRGACSPSKFPNTWRAFVACDWRDASARLCNAGLWSGYHMRRRREGLLLKELF